MSTTLPLPSSPHCVPTTTMFGMCLAPALAWTLIGETEIAFGRLENRRHPEDALGVSSQIDREQLPGRCTVAPDDQRHAHTVRARVFEGFRECAADDVA